MRRFSFASEQPIIFLDKTTCGNDGLCLQFCWMILEGMPDLTRTPHVSNRNRPKCTLCHSIRSASGVRFDDKSLEFHRNCGFGLKLKACQGPGLKACGTLETLALRPRQLVENRKSAGINWLSMLNNLQRERKLIESAVIHSYHLSESNFKFDTKTSKTEWPKK